MTESEFALICRKNQQNHLQRERRGAGLFLRCRDDRSNRGGDICHGIHAPAEHLECEWSHRDKQGSERNEKCERTRKPKHRRVETWQKYCQRHRAGEDISLSYICLFAEKVRQAAEKIHYIYYQRGDEQLPENERQAQKIYHQPFADYPPGHGRVPLVQPACYRETVSVEYAEKVTVVGFENQPSEHRAEKQHGGGECGDYRARRILKFFQLFSHLSPPPANAYGLAAVPLPQRTRTLLRRYIAGHTPHSSSAASVL